MFYSHTRQLGAQAGTQLNPVRDNTDGTAPDGADQAAAFVGRFKRGRIDAPFKVNRGNLLSKLGSPESLRVSSLNEAYVQVYEAVNNGTSEAVVARLITAAAANKYATFKIDEGTGASSFTADATIPVTPYIFALKDLECFNDGVILEVHAPKVLNGVAPAATDVITLRVREPNGALRIEVTGSLDKAAVDEFGQDFFIGTKIAQQSDVFQITASASATVPVNADCYGNAEDGSPKFATTGAAPLVLFSEGGTAYSNTDYDAAVALLENSTFDVGYIGSGGSQATALLSKLGAMAIRANRQFEFDIPGNLDVAGAQTFINQLGFASHYVQAYWAPLETDDPVNGGRAIIGTSGMNIGMRCARNAQTNAYGLAPKNFPVAGKSWPITRTGVKQLVSPTDPQLNELALAKINPVLFERYNGGSAFVFRDVLTTAKTQVSYKKLISVAEMSSSLDDMVVKKAKEVLLLPMEVAISQMNDFLTFLFNAARASGWLVASDTLGETGYAYTVKRNAVSPADRMDVAYSLHYDGVARAVHITQTLSR